MKPCAALTNEFSRFDMASALMLNYANEIEFGPSGPILEVGCGYGRNVLALARLNIPIIAVDNDFARLHELAQFARNERINALGDVNIVCADLLCNSWPIRKDSLSGILCVHFPDLKPVGMFHEYIKTGGWLCIETFGAHGENYRQLPSKGEIYEVLKSHFTFLHYKEKRVGRRDSDAITVKLFARKRED